MILPARTICIVLLLLSAVKGTFVNINTPADYCVIGESSSDDNQKQCQKTSTTMSSESEQKYEAGLHSIAFVTTPNPSTAKDLAQKLVEQKLAACVNIIPGMTSIYVWEGKMNEDQEFLLMIKTRTDRVDEMSKFVRKHHPYSVAELISVKIENGNQPYMDWLSKSVMEAKK